MIPIFNEETEKLAHVLERYAPRATIARAAGLLTVPSLQANTVRIEVLVHLAVAFCNGKEKAGYAEFGRWLNNYLGNSQMSMYEDPVEDVFITNVQTTQGNRRVFEGIWESNDYFLLVLLDTLSSRKAPQECRDLLKPAYALLSLSEHLAERLRLARWSVAPSRPKVNLNLGPRIQIEDRARAVTFTKAELEGFGIDLQLLSSFIMQDDDKKKLIEEETGHSTLELKPLIDFGDAIVLALPNAVSPAIRRFALTQLRKLGYLEAFSNALSVRQARQIEENALWEFRAKAVSVDIPKLDDSLTPSLHSWLLMYDINRYLHVVMLDDQLNTLEEEGLTSYLEYSEDVLSSFEKYLIRVRDYCESLPDYIDGTTLIVIGGLGRGFGLRLSGLTKRNWCWSCIRINDFILLASDVQRPVQRYLKFIKQAEWVEEQDVLLMNMNGDFNLYCYWLRSDYQLVPREIPVDSGAMISIGNDFVFPIREELRTSIDDHLVKTSSGEFVRVVKYGRDAYFKLIQESSIYVSIKHLRYGVLAGAIETSRGVTWLIVESDADDSSVKHLLYEMWSGFLGLFDRLVKDIEMSFPALGSDAVELRLNFRDLEVQEDFVEQASVSDLEVLLEPEPRRIEIKFPADFLINFQGHENTGEVKVISALARGLLELYKVIEQLEYSEEKYFTLVSNVIGDSGLRVLHMFHTYYPIEHLLSQHNYDPTFLSHEDFVFNKLNLSEGCYDNQSTDMLATKSECNQFLHNVVLKLWNKLKVLFANLDRVSVLKCNLEIIEAAINDRDNWRRTAQAVIALYKSYEDVYKIAGKRESERAFVSLAARTVIEMAICECPVSGGRQASKQDIDELIALVGLLIEAATDSDAINFDLVEPKIKLYLNGEYSINRGFYDNLIKPFQRNYQKEEFEDAAESYSELYSRELHTKRNLASEIYSKEFNYAFMCEFGLTPDEAIDGFAELMDIVVEQKSIIVQVTRMELMEKFTQKRGLSITASENFLKMVGLRHRSTWITPPDGYSNKDLEPWRYRRRLSLTVKPVLIFGESDSDIVLYGAGLVQQGFAYLLRRSERGHLPDKFFMTQEMKQYIGSVNNERGHAFARRVADKLSELGWQVRNEVNMSELGAPKKEADGDIDVLAWKPSGEVLLIECKRLQLARTVAEIAEICRRFKGNAKDELDKHVRRVNWVVSFPTSLSQIVGFVPNQKSIDARLVTNTHVPMMYINSLPMPANKIVPINALS
ncbi:MAG: hypothetical protein SFU55_00565 [Methylophilus sp.]|nr:hypothetical protein [Methylophilus sp.]